MDIILNIDNLLKSLMHIKGENNSTKNIAIYIYLISNPQAKEILWKLVIINIPYIITQFI